jgi:hypothetical protein
MIDILDAVKIEEIYAFNLKSIVDICKYLNIWETLCQKDKEFYLSLIDKNKFKDIKDLSFWENYSNDFVYGEITKSGVIELSNYLKDFNGNFYDIGSGNGKLLLHMSFISNFDKFVGIEICEPRHLYALEINSIVEQNVNFICDDVKNVDISDADVIFLNDVMFSKELIKSIIEKIPTGAHYISAYKNEKDFVKDIYLDVTWFDIIKNTFYLHKKN